MGFTQKTKYDCENKIETGFKKEILNAGSMKFMTKKGKDDIIVIIPTGIGRESFSSTTKNIAPIITRVMKRER